ncbi:hypothetical protein NFI96_024229 [Prochilodus magdalenae]|nr:hypothetical protein NFI96_024229 [Prochilodus magdalenae]
MIVDMRKERRPHQPLFILDLEVERVSSFKYLGVHISDDLTWTLNTTYVLKRAQQRLYFLRRLRKFGMSPRILSNFYSCIIESILTSCITVWYGSTTVKDRKRLQRVICGEFHRITNINLKNHFYAALGRHLQSLFRMKASHTGKVSEVLGQLFRMYDLQVSWLHFLMPYKCTTVDFGLPLVKFHL